MDLKALALSKILNQGIHSSEGVYYVTDENGELQAIDIAPIQAQFDAELEYFTLQQQSNEAKIYLNQTDWVVVKISEISLTGTQEDVDALKVKYANILSERAAKRVVINNFENL